MRISGDRAELRAGPHVAAVLGAWSLSRVEDRQNQGAWTATARVLSRDAFWSEHGGALDLVVPVEAVRWRWRGVIVRWGDGEVGVEGIGKPEVEP